MASASACVCRSTLRSATSRIVAAAAGPSRSSAFRATRTLVTVERPRTSARTGNAWLRAPTHQQRRSMFCQTETTPNEDALKFIPGQVLSESGQTHEFLSSQEARSSPLASALFDIPGVRVVFFGPDFVSVTKSEDSQWALMKPEIYATIIEHFSQGKPLFYDGSKQGDGPEDTRILDTDSEVVAMIKELLDTRVRPAIQEDGGDIEYKGFDEASGLVKVSLKGSCRGCDSSTVTLKNGIERMLMHYIPEVKGVEQLISAEEAVAADEFAKFEERLRAGGKTVEI